MLEHCDASDLRWGWAGGELHAAQWDDEVAVFHALTASTHLVDQDAYRVLVQMSSLAGSTASTADLWLKSFGEPPSASEASALSAQLQALVQAGLVTSTSP